MRLPFTLLHFATKNYLLAQANRAPLHFCICSVGYAAYKKAKNQVLKEANISIFTAATMFKQMNNITCSLCGRNITFPQQPGGRLNNSHVNFWRLAMPRKCYIKFLQKCGN